MKYELAPFRSVPLTEALLEHLIEEHRRKTVPWLQRLWLYFRNELAAQTPGGGSAGPPAQSVGLPARLRASRHPDRDDRFAREIVIENDIAWRIHTLVDFMFPQPPRIVSRAADSSLKRTIETLLDAVIDENGGVSLWQDMSLLGSVYGSVDLLLNAEALFRNFHSFDAPGGTGANSFGGDSAANGLGEAASNPLPRDEAQHLASLISIEAVEAPRAIPLLDPSDYRKLDLYVIHYERLANALQRPGVLTRWVSTGFRAGRAGASRRATTVVTIIHSATHEQRYENGLLVHESRNPLGRIPVVHVQNLAQPFRYHGLSDVEPLIPLQDELNTRLSDRAHRVTMQSFRMYLGKGIDGFTDRPIGPGQMWMTDNTEASIDTFGGDAASPSEDAHVEQLREALDKASGVTPAAAGHIKAKIGNLTSENALRVSLMGTIAKIKRKRVTYGQGIGQLCELILHALHRSGRFRTSPLDRRVEVVWPDPLPSDETRRIQDALSKAQLGVSLQQLRAELGYADAEPSTTTEASTLGHVS